MKPSFDRDVLVIGGGISGLTTAWHLHNAGVDAALLESSPSPGGCTRTQQKDGFSLEKGPFNVMVRDPAFEKLLEALSSELTVITASREARKRYIYRHRRLVPVPASPFQFLSTPLLTLGGRLRLLRGLLFSSRAAAVEETIEQVATRRVGRQAAESIVSAAISGIFAGDIRKLSLSACFPAVGEIDRQTRSLLGYGLTAALKRFVGGKKRPKRRWRGLVSIEGGLGALTGALGQRLGDRLMLRTRVESIETMDGGFAVHCQTDGGDPTTLRCRRLVMACPAAEAARLLKPHLPAAADELATIESASVAVLNLGYRKSDVGHPMDGFGFLVPQNEPDVPLMGVLWADTVFPHLAPRDARLIRVFMGGARDPDVGAKTDDQLVSAAHSFLAEVMQLSGKPTMVDVTWHRSAIPQYHLGHAAKVSRIRAATDGIDNLHLVGNYLEGVSLNDCVRLATAKAQQLIEQRETQPREATVEQATAVA